MSIRAITEAFQEAAHPSIACVGARMRYSSDRKHQILEFDVIQNGKQRTIVSDPIKHMEVLTVHAAKIAAAQPKE